MPQRAHHGAVSSEPPLLGRGEGDGRSWAGAQGCSWAALCFQGETRADSAAGLRCCSLPLQEGLGLVLL